MELTPAERVKLNAAIVNAAKTGQPLSSELQSLYNRAAQVEQAKPAQPQYPTRDVSDILWNRTVDTSQGIRWGKAGAAVEIVPHSGPASSLPVTDWDELYPKTIPIEEDFFDTSGLRLPFGREFDFTQPPVNIRDTESVQERSKRFLNQYFAGQNPGPVVNPATGRNYGNELTLHDAMHDFANVGNTLRGEELITIAENIGATPLAAENIGLKNLTQQEAVFTSDPSRAYEKGIEYAERNARMTGPTLVQQRGAARGSSLFRDANNVGSFLSPPISQEEFNTMAQRGQEFYDQVQSNWDAFRKGGGVEWSDANNRAGREIRTRAANAFMNSEYGPPRVITQQIAGGYNTGGIPYGNKLSLMNAPVVPTVSTDLWQQELNKAVEKAVPALQEKIKQEQLAYSSPEQVEARALPGRWDVRKNALLSLTNETDPGYLEFAREKYADQGLDIDSPEFQRDQRVYRALAQAGSDKGTAGLQNIEDAIGTRPIAPKRPPVTRATNLTFGDWILPDDPDFFEGALKKSDSAIKTALDKARGAFSGGVTSAAPIYKVRGGGGVAYLNPANLGANYQGTVQYPTMDADAIRILEGAGINSSDLLLDVAAKAKQIEGYNKALPNITQAIRTGYKTTMDLAGSVPLFDPAFRQAIEQGDAGKAARQVATEYAIGTAVAPVVGAGAGLAQRLAPATTAAVLPVAAGALRVANPVAVVSQLGGSAKPSKRQQSIERQQSPEAYNAQGPSANPQLLRAEAARRRGSRWKFPTPFGTLRIPELGISEAGGLFFR